MPHTPKERDRLIDTINFLYTKQTNPKFNARKLAEFIQDMRENGLEEKAEEFSKFTWKAAYRFPFSITDRDGYDIITTVIHLVNGDTGEFKVGLVGDTHPRMWFSSDEASCRRANNALAMLNGYSSTAEWYEVREEYVDGKKVPFLRFGKGDTTLAEEKLDQSKLGEIHYNCLEAAMRTYSTAFEMAFNLVSNKYVHRGMKWAMKKSKKFYQN